MQRGIKDRIEDFVEVRILHLERLNCSRAHKANIWRQIKEPARRFIIGFADFVFFSVYVFFSSFKIFSPMLL
jgi:hypothetical protein